MFRQFASTVQLWQAMISEQAARATYVMNRFVSIILIIAVLQCTFSCTSGSCCAVDSQTSVVAPASRSCCSHCRGLADSSSELPAKSRSKTSDEPHDGRDSDCCPCQGACSGMVRSKHVELKTAPNSVPLSLIVELPVLRGCFVLDSSAIEDVFPNQKTAHGLSMRVRVCSLIC